MSLRAASIGLAVATVAVVAACSQSESGSGATANAGSATSSGSGGASGGAGGEGTVGVGGGGPVCNPSCQSPQICSYANVCIDPGTCADDKDCGTGLVCDLATKQCVPGGQCGGQEAKADAVPPNMLIVLDRSCSMTELVNGATKWAIAVGAVDKLTTDFDSKIRFGLTLFPDLTAPNCDQGVIPIPVAPGNEMAIDTLLNASLSATDPYYPDGPCVTNIDTAMEQASTEPAFNDTTRASYVVLITDGKQAGCSLGGGDTGTTQTITDLYQMKQVATFVVGFGGAVDPAQMNIFADAGGAPNMDPADPATHFYKADDQTSLEAALTAIASHALGCVFALDTAPPDPNKIYVFFNNDPAGISKDPSHMNGWDYDPATNEVTFYGAACDSLKKGQVSDVDIVFGCDMPTPQ